MLLDVAEMLFADDLGEWISCGHEGDLLSYPICRMNGHIHRRNGKRWACPDEKIARLTMLAGESSWRFFAVSSFGRWLFSRRTFSPVVLERGPWVMALLYE